MFTKKDFTELINYNGEYPIISIFTPTHRAGEATWNGKDALKLKNIVLEIKRSLEDSEMNYSEIESLLAPVVDMYENQDFWLKQSDGLAIFLAKGFFKYFQVPTSFESNYYVGEKFHMKPLIPYIKSNNRFFLLDLNQQHVRLFECMNYSITEIEVSDVMPRNLEEALPEEHHSTTLQFHTTKGGKNDGGAIFHGQGGHKSEHSTDLEKFFRLINTGVEKLLHDEKVPLLLGGVDYLIPIYKSVSTYNFLVEDKHISGNIQNDDLSLIHEKSWSQMSEFFDEERKNRINKYNEVAYSEVGIDKVDEVVKAAYNGRVETLFLSKTSNYWGTFDVKNQKVIQKPNQEVNATNDLLNDAGIQCVLNGGNVYLLDQKNMPSENSTACAILRY